MNGSLKLDTISTKSNTSECSLACAQLPEGSIVSSNSDHCSRSNSSDSEISADMRPTTEVRSRPRKRIHRSAVKDSKHSPLSKEEGPYFEFEKAANGWDGYFDQSSDDELGANEKNCLSFETCRAIQRNSSSKTAADIAHSKERSKRHGRKSSKNILIADEASLDDILCEVQEGFSSAPPLAEEDEFDDFEV
ncbi:hypothetical protein AB6A40_006085 [Gnathostoma spinigerum]|uniref:Uncharacterized protein n=1 Tax=Gnathostoma spinigerum TaxID=75299 RepID=A0ABD6EPL9_9BILA